MPNKVAYESQLHYIKMPKCLGFHLVTSCANKVIKGLVDYSEYLVGVCVCVQLTSLC